MNMQVSWVPGWKENFNIHTASLMIYSIYSNSYTFAVEFRYENNEEFIKDKEIVNFLRQSRDTEELFCLEEVSFNDSAFIITFQEHTENNGFASIIENFENYSQKTGSYIFVWWLSAALGIASAVINIPIREVPVARPAAAAA